MRWMNDLAYLLDQKVMVGVAVILIGMGAIAGALITYVVCQ